MNLAQHLQRQNEFWSIPVEYEYWGTGITGFDLVKCKVYVKNIQWDVLESIISSSNGHIHTDSPSPEDHIKYTYTSQKGQLLCIPGNKQFSAIIIKYLDFTLKLQAANIQIKANKVSDTMQLCIYEKPVNPHLGNIDNYSCFSLQSRIHSIMDSLEVYGIYLDREHVTLNYVEINHNYVFETDHFLSYFNTAFSSLPHRFSILPKYEPWGFCGVTDQLGIFANSSTICIHVYEKIMELESSNNKLYICSPKHIYRVEFVIKTPKQISRWLGSDNPFDIEQVTVDTAFINLLNKYVIDMYTAHFNRFYDFVVDTFNTDTTKKHWSDDYIRDLVTYSNRFKIDISFLTPKIIR